MFRWGHSRHKRTASAGAAEHAFSNAHEDAGPSGRMGPGHAPPPHALASSTPHLSTGLPAHMLQQHGPYEGGWPAHLQPPPSLPGQGSQHALSLHDEASLEEQEQAMFAQATEASLKEERERQQLERERQQRVERARRQEAAKQAAFELSCQFWQTGRWVGGCPAMQWPALPPHIRPSHPPLPRLRAPPPRSLSQTLADGFYMLYGDFPELEDMVRASGFPSLEALRRVPCMQGDVREVVFVDADHDSEPRSLIAIQERAAAAVAAVPKHGDAAQALAARLTVRAWAPSSAAHACAHACRGGGGAVPRAAPPVGPTAQ